MARAQLNRQEVFKALTDSGTFATVLHVICLLSYGEEIYTVDPLELYARLKDDYHAEITEENENRLQAIILATSTDAFYEDENAFRGIVNTLLDGDPGVDSLDELTLEEIFWAVYEVELNHDEEAFSPMVEATIQRLIAEETDDPEEYGDIDEFRPNYVIRAMVIYRRQLDKQLKAIGVKDIVLPPVS